MDENREGPAAPSPPNSRAGRPRFEPTVEHRNTVKALAGFGLNEKQIADFLGIANTTLRRHFRSELAKARMLVMGKAMSGLANALNREEPWAVKFVLATLGRTYGWTQHIPPTPTPPAEPTVPLRLSSLSDSQLVQLLQRLELYAASLD